MEIARRMSSSGHTVGVDLNADFVAAASRRAQANNLEVCYVLSEFPPYLSTPARLTMFFAKTSSNTLIQPPTPS
jgi:hypothetical protein